MTFAGMIEGMIPFARKRVIGREDEASIWSVRANWSALVSIDDPRDGDQVAVTDVDGNGSAGVARWSTADEEWQVHSVVTTTASRLTSITRPIAVGAIAGVGSGTASSLMRYVYDGATWVRVASGRAVVWASADPAAVAITDPSGIGVTHVGDLLVITTSVGTETLRLYSFAAPQTPNATARLAWVDAGLPATGLILAGYFDGTESADSDLTTRGADTISEASGSIVYTGARVSFECTAGPGRNVQAQYRTGAVGTASQVYTRGLYRAAVGAGADATTSCVANFGIIADGTNAARVYASSAINATAIRCVDGSQVLQGAADSSLAALPGLAGTDEMVTILSETATGLVRVRRNGRLECSARRNQGTLASQRISVGAFTSASATNAVTQQVRHYIAVIVP
jgi:hypothetical protein